MALIGWALQRPVLERSARGGLLVPVLTTFGLSIVIDNLLFEQFGADTRSLAPYIGDLSYDSWSLTDDIAIGKLAALTMAVGDRRCSAASSSFSIARRSAGRSARRPRIPTPSASSASTRGASTRSPPAIAMATVAIAGAFLGDARDLRPLRRRGATDLRLRGGGDRRRRLAVGHACSAASCSASPRASARSISPQGFFIAGHLAFLAVLFARLFSGDLGRACGARSPGGGAA